MIIIIKRMSCWRKYNTRVEDVGTPCFVCPEHGKSISAGDSVRVRAGRGGPARVRAAGNVSVAGEGGDASVKALHVYLRYRRFSIHFRVTLTAIISY